MLGALAAASVICIGAAGCSGDGASDGPAEASGTSETSAAAELCGGAMSPAAQKALARLTGSTDLRSTDDDDTRSAAETLVAGWKPLSTPSGPAVDADLCAVSSEENWGNGPADVRIKFALSDADTAKGGHETAEELTPYEMGERASVGTQYGFLWFSCTSEQLAGSKESPAYIQTEVRNALPQDGDAGELRDANATVVHSASLALARQLKCDGGGGLESEPALKFSS
ncbi:hypothetical protein ABZ070_13545 [Streptomyces sp. NPDC006283]|uniref:hypothetical protein n=1 Tax=Streptomyces sp. NPDC006283 TaxID=3156741 RepID=UPI0033B0D255